MNKLLVGGRWLVVGGCWLAVAGCGEVGNEPVKAQAPEAETKAAAPAVSKSVPQGWTEDFEAAKAAAKKEGKYVLVMIDLPSDEVAPCGQRTKCGVNEIALYSHREGARRSQRRICLPSAVKESR